MKIFDNKGLMVIPNPLITNDNKEEQRIVVTGCYCSNGHNLVNKQARFGKYHGIVLKAYMNGNKGILALSPVFGDKSKITVDIELEDDKLVQLACPICNAELLVYGNCDCGGSLLVMFTKPLSDFNNCIGICNRVGCAHSEIKNEGQLLSISASEIF